MDHVIDYIKEYMWSETNDFVEEWQSGEYKKLSDCPTYPIIKAYCDAIRILGKAAYKPEYVEDFTPTTIIRLESLYNE